MKPTDAELIRAAFKARSFAYTPYSHFKVGAALLAKNGMVYTGCNIENAGYTPTNCAERTALFKAVSEGVTEFTDIAIVGSLDGKKNTLVTGPCGVCRQALYEFCGPRLRVLMAKSEDDYIETTLGDLLPYGFGPTNLEIEPGGRLRRLIYPNKRRLFHPCLYPRTNVLQPGGCFACCWRWPLGWRWRAAAAALPLNLLHRIRNRC